MIHDVKLPRETRIYLWQIVRVQMDLLCCATALPGELSQEKMQERLAERMPSQRAEGLSQWLFAHKAPREALQRFADDNRKAETASLVEQMGRDVVRLYRGRAQETLECCFPAKNLTVYQQGAKDFLIYFYDSLGSGLDGALFRRNPCDYPKYGREQFFAAVERENPEQYVCAICDEHRYMTSLRGEYFSDIEHYFPKSIYPHLACHPYNLIPICKQCNTAHLNVDPLKKADSRRTLGEIFLPYRAEGVAGRSVIRFEWQPTRSPDERPHLEMQSRRNDDSALDTKLQALREIYDIPGRWQGRIHQIGEQLWRYIRHYVRVEVEQDGKVDLLRLKAELEQLLSYLFEDLGKSPWTYVLIWYLGNILVEEIEAEVQKSERSEIVPVLDTIREVVADGQDSVSSYRSRANDALVIARKLYNQERTAA